jgi:hypothetical protein
MPEDGQIEVAAPNGLMVVESVAESLAVLVSPPPETDTELVTLAGALPATLSIRPLHGFASGDPLVLDNAEVAVVFAVLLAICAAEEQVIRRMPEKSTV